MFVSDIMTCHPVTIRSTSTVREALEAMERVGCHHLPVLSDSKHLVGVITARDCRLALSLPDVDPRILAHKNESPARSVCSARAWRRRLQFDEQ